MAEFTRTRSEEYWRPAPAVSNAPQRPGFPTQLNQPFCTNCGAPFAMGALFCHLCGFGREGDRQSLARSRARNALKNWFDLGVLRAQFGLSPLSLACLLVAAIFMLAAVMTGLVYNTSNLAEWQAVQCWRIEWLLATVVALMAAMLFRIKR